MELSYALIGIAALFGLFYFTDTALGKKFGNYIRRVVPRPVLRFLFAYFMGIAAVASPGGFLILVPFERVCDAIGIDNALLAYALTLLVLSIIYAKGGEKETDQEMELEEQKKQ